MIKKMTKYSFVIFHKEVEDFLKNLQETGVVDVTRQKRAIDSYSMNKFEEIAKYNSVISALNRLLAEANSKKVEIPSGKPQSTDYIAYYNSLIEKKDQYKVKLFNLNADYTAALPWGTFNNNNLTFVHIIILHQFLLLFLLLERCVHILVV